MHYYKKALSFIFLLFMYSYSSFPLEFNISQEDLFHKIDLNPGINWYIGKPGIYVKLPLGLLSLLIAERNPILYLTNTEIFKNSFDLLSFYEQMSYLYSFLFNPASSPDEIVFAIDNQGLDVFFPDNSEYTFSELYWKPKLIPFIPESMLQFFIPFKPFYFSIDLYAGTTGLTLVLDENLSVLLDNGDLHQETEYNLEANLGLRTGIALTTTYIILLYSNDSWFEMLFFDRVGIFFDLAFIYTQFNLYFKTNQESLPELYSYTAGIFSGYPSNGIGLGFKNDIGINCIFYKNLMISLICLQCARGKVYWGDTEIYSSESEDNTDLFQDINIFEIKPVFYIQSLYEWMPFLFELGFIIPTHSESSLLYYEGSVHLVLKPVTAGFSFKWRDYLTTKTIFSYTISHININTGITTHQSPFLRKIVYGIFLSLGYSW